MVAFSDGYSGNRVMLRWILSGTLIGLVAGAIAGWADIPITNRLAASSPLATRLISWMLAGSLIGLGLGLRWIHVNRMRAAHAYVGGLFGGLLGGTIFAVVGSRIPDFSQAVGFIVVGIGICFGVTFSPLLLPDALPQFFLNGVPKPHIKFLHS